MSSWRIGAFLHGIFESMLDSEFPVALDRQVTLDMARQSCCAFYALSMKLHSHFLCMPFVRSKSLSAAHTKEEGNHLFKKAVGKNPGQVLKQPQSS